MQVDKGTRSFWSDVIRAGSFLILLMFIMDEYPIDARRYSLYLGTLDYMEQVVQPAVWVDRHVCIL